MHIRRVSGALGAVFLCSVCFASVKAESVFDYRLTEQNHRESFRLELPDINRSDSFGYFRNEESDYGRHLGFSSEFKYIGPRIEVVGYPQVRTTAVTQNPEPTTMVLLGTGLMVFAGYARRIKRNRDR